MRLQDSGTMLGRYPLIGRALYLGGEPFAPAGPVARARLKSPAGARSSQTQVSIKISNMHYCQATTNKGHPASGIFKRIRVFDRPLSGPSPALEILRWPEHKDALDPLSVEMLEVSGVARQKIVGLSVNRSQ